MIKVKATRLGYYDLQRRKEDEIFDIQDDKEFSPKWMEKVGDSEPARAEENHPREEKHPTEKKHHGKHHGHGRSHSSEDVI